ncbi:MAG: hypothetical protein Q4G69_05905 [Planctomycetia bacterium]|nr:hypothetical protein [Planctomycetia bacterium]
MSQYYNLEKTSEILKLTPGEVNRLREQGKLHGFRDGIDWKFRQEDVEKYLTDMIKARNPDANMDLLGKGEEDTPTILASAQSSNFASLLDQATDSLDLNTGTDDNADFFNLVPQNDSGNDETTLFTSDDGLNLDGDEGLTLPSGGDDFDLDLGGDEGLVLGGTGGSMSDLDLGGDSGLVLGGSSPSSLDLNGDSGLVIGGSGSDLNLGTGSGISLLDDQSSFDLSSEGDNIVLNAGGSGKEKLGGNDLAVADETTISSSGTLDEDGLFALANDVTIAPTGTPSLAPADEETQLALTDSETDKSEPEEDIFKLAGEEPASVPSHQAKIDLEKNTPEPEEDDDDIFKLAPEPDDASTMLAEPSQKPVISPEALEKKEDEDDSLFQLVSETPADDESSVLALHPGADTESSTVLGEISEDFQLAPSGDAQEDSDSGSASQVIQIDDENSPFVSEDGGDSNPPGSDFSSPFETLEEGNGFPGAGSFGDPESSDQETSPFGEQPTEDAGGFGPPFETAEDQSGQTFPGTGPGPSAGPGFGEELPQTATATEGCSWAAGKGCLHEAHFSGLDILLVLVPSLIILIPTAMAAYELIRFIWSWDEPFTLTGTILEFVGGLFKII